MTQSSDLEAYAADATENIDSDDLLARITQSVRDLTQAQQDVTTAEGVLKTAQDKVRQIEEFILPELMREAGQEMCCTADGVTVELTEKLFASLPVATAPQALKWLAENGQAAIIKRELLLKFGKNEEDKADRALAAILEGGFTPQDKSSVHPQTLAAVIREMLAQGVDVPMELLGAYVRSFAKLKLPKR